MGSARGFLPDSPGVSEAGSHSYLSFTAFGWSSSDLPVSGEMLVFYAPPFQPCRTVSVPCNTRPGSSQMNKIIFLIGMMVATTFVGRAALQFSGLPIIGGGDPVETRSKASTEPGTARGDSNQDEPAYKAVIRCLSDLDDLLDGIVNPATSVTLMPLLLRRVRQHVAQASEHPQGMSKLSGAASQEMQQAMNRHAASLMRANKVAPGVTRFFDHEVAGILNPK